MNNKRSHSTFASPGRHWNKNGGGSRAYNFPSWNYGCTLGNNEQTGAYETYVEEKDNESAAGGVPSIQMPPPPPPPGEPPIEEEKGEEDSSNIIDEKPLQEILQGRNPIVFCNEQSKMRGMNMEWEQVSESGPPHMKVFTWTLKVGGELSVEAASNSKKSAKNKAAEAMARKLDALPRPNKKRSHGQMMGGYPPAMMMGGYPPLPPEMMPPWGPKPPRPKKKKPSSNNNSGGEDKPPNPSQDNPISQLYEYCKRIKSPEPVFTTICENTLESRVTERGFHRKKLEFTLQVEVSGKKFEGTAMTKKEAKHRAAGVAWTAIQEESKTAENEVAPSG